MRRFSLIVLGGVVSLPPAITPASLATTTLEQQSTTILRNAESPVPGLVGHFRSMCPNPNRSSSRGLETGASVPAAPTSSIIHQTIVKKCPDPSKMGRSHAYHSPPLKTIYRPIPLFLANAGIHLWSLRFLD
jgi:hypothetical protein